MQIIKILIIFTILIFIIYCTFVSLSNDSLSNDKLSNVIGGNVEKHEIGDFIMDYSKRLVHKNKMVALHPLGATTYTYKKKVKGGKKNKIKKWTSFKTWDELKNNEYSLNEYMEQRSQFLNNPNLDWSDVLEIVLPKLNDNKEYIGIINLRKNKLYVSRMEASTTTINANADIFASIPEELVAEICEIPGLFVFHTHPADTRGSPLPSSHDILTAINLGAVTRYAGSVVISRYGILVHGLDWSAYKAINRAKDWEAALLNYSFDVVTAHETIRSWSSHKLDDYLDFYSRYRMYMFVYPSYEMIGDKRKYDYLWDLETPIDNKLIDDLNKDIFIHASKYSISRKN
jgi:hypothetical protein